jgi:hypothetical protein
MKPLALLFLAPALWGQQAHGLSQPFTSLFGQDSFPSLDMAIRGGGTAGMGSDMAMVQSLQQHFNRLPPSGSPVLLGN